MSTSSPTAGSRLHPAASSEIAPGAQNGALTSSPEEALAGSLGAMPLEPPDPHMIASLLRAQLDQLRQLVTENPREPAYAKAADHVASAIAPLASIATPQAAP